MVARSTAAPIAAGTDIKVTVDPINVAISAPATGRIHRHRRPRPAPRRRPAKRHSPAPASVAAMAVGEIAIDAVTALRARPREHPHRRTETVHPLKVSAAKAGQIVGKTADPIAGRAATTVTGVTAVADPRVVTAGATTAVRIATIASRR